MTKVYALVSNFEGVIGLFNNKDDVYSLLSEYEEWVKTKPAYDYTDEWYVTVSEWRNTSPLLNTEYELQNINKTLAKLSVMEYTLNDTVDESFKEGDVLECIDEEWFIGCPEFGEYNRKMLDRLESLVIESIDRNGDITLEPNYKNEDLTCPLDIYLEEQHFFRKKGC